MPEADVQVRDVKATWCSPSTRPHREGDADVHEEVPPDELFRRLQPFNELVAEDIERRGED
jgi:hypothetical protein